METMLGQIVSQITTACCVLLGYDPDCMQLGPSLDHCERDKAIMPLSRSASVRLLVLGAHNRFLFQQVGTALRHLG